MMKERSLHLVPVLVALVAIALIGCASQPEALRDLPTLSPAEATQSAVTRRLMAEDFAGEYHISAEDAGWTVWIKTNLSYEQSSFLGATNQRLSSAGRIVPRGSTVRVVPSSGSEPDVLIPVKWGQRRYLVRGGAIGRFCAPSSGKPRTSSQGEFFLRDGDWSRPVEGVPTLLDGTPACP